MVAGETEALLAAQSGEEVYDNFLFKKRTESSKRERRNQRKQKRFVRQTKRVERKTEKRNSPTRIMRKERRNTLIKNLGSVYKDISEATGIGAKIKGITSPNDSDTDYTMSIGSENSPTKKSNIPKIAMIVGGVLVVGIIGVVVMKKRTD